MEYSNFTAKKDDDDRRLDKVVSKLFSSFPVSLLQKNIRNGFIRVNGKKSKADTRIHEGDVIGVAGVLLNPVNSPTKPLDSINTVNKHDIEVPVIFQNNQIIVYNKPYDLPVQKSDKDDFSLVEYSLLNHSSESSLSFKIGPLHRLDRKTTGLVIFSQSLEGARLFSAAIATHSTKKTYLAIVQGKANLPLNQTYTWEDYLKPLENEKNGFHLMEVSSDTDAKKAITELTLLASGQYNNLAVYLAYVNIKTGRKHQIRAQSSFHGLPLLGDTAYGGQKINEKQDFYLHAYRLEFTELGKDYESPFILEAPLNQNFIDMANKSSLKCLKGSQLGIIL